jgi:hypothetical protein
MTRSRLLAALGAVIVLAFLGVGAMVLFGGHSGSGNAAATQTPLADPLPPDTVPSESPTIEPYATAPEEKAVTASPEAKKSPMLVPKNFDGCDHSYGEISQCIPSTFPGGLTSPAQKCKWLAGHGLPHPKVLGNDSQHLDADHNKVACDH